MSNGYDLVPARLRKAKNRYKTLLLKYNADQGRDDHGRFASGGTGVNTARAALHGAGAGAALGAGLGGSRGVAQGLRMGLDRGFRGSSLAGAGAAGYTVGAMRGSVKGALAGALLAGGANALINHMSKPVKKRAFSADQRKAAVKTGAAMQGGRYPIETATDLHNAIHAVGRGKGSHNAIRDHIKARAAVLGLTSQVPDEWEKRYAGAVAVEKAASDADLKDGIVWGWASIIEKDGKTVTDHQGDQISEEELVKAAHDFVSNSQRTGGAMHIYTKSADGKTPMKCGDIVESMVFTKDLQKAMGIDLGKVGWAIGYKITNPTVRKAAARGDLPSFSIGGSGTRVPV